MTESLTIQGRHLSAAQLQELRQWAGENPHWSRRGGHLRDDLDEGHAHELGDERDQRVDALWVRLKIAAGSYSTNPVLTQAWVIGGGDHLASDLSLTTANEWMDGGTVANTSYAIGDSLEIVLRSVTGSPTSVGVQCAGFTLA